MARPVTATMAVQLVDILRCKPGNSLRPINASLIRKWAERQTVRRYGLNQDGHQLYDLHDIMKTAAS
jgi:hypothetical protein